MAQQINTIRARFTMSLMSELQAEFHKRPRLIKATSGRLLSLSLPLYTELQRNRRREFLVHELVLLLPRR
jgi:hypothetical protein